MATDDLLTAEQVAEILHLSKRTVQDLLKGSKLQGFKLAGKNWLVRREDLDNYVEERRRAFIENEGQRGRPLK